MLGFPPGDWWILLAIGSSGHLPRSVADSLSAVHMVGIGGECVMQVVFVFWGVVPRILQVLLVGRERDVW